VRLALQSGVTAGRHDAVAFLSALAARTSVTLRADMVILDQEALFADLAVEIDCLADAPDFRIAPMRAGQVLKGRLFTLHRLDGDGRITEIKTAVYGAWDGPA
jgi:hypothetical protein